MPEGGPKLLLIDGNNLSYRVFFTHQELAYKGKLTGVLFGFFKQLVRLHKEYPNHFRIIAWDGGYARRLDESKKAVEAGIIPSAYKENRKERDKEELQALFDQMDQLREVLDGVRCVQVRIDGVEADDIINTYSRYAAKWGGEAVVISSDKDFYQVIQPGVKIHDTMKDEIWSYERFEKEYGFNPSLWVDAGAIMGDSGDNIHGADGWGPVTTCKYIREHGGLDAVLEAVRAKEKKTKKEEVLLQSEAVVRLARSLKQMDIIPNLPRPRMCRPIVAGAIKQFFIEHGFVSLMQEASRLE